MEFDAKIIETIKGALDASSNGEAVDPKLLNMLDKNNLDYRMNDLGFDSLQVMEFCIFIEISTGIEIDVPTLLTCATMRDLAALLKEKSG